MHHLHFRFVYETWNDNLCDSQLLAERKNAQSSATLKNHVDLEVSRYFKLNWDQSQSHEYNMMNCGVS